MSNKDKRLPIAGQPAPDALERLLQGDSASVIEALAQHLANAPDDDAAWLRLGVSYESIGHLPEAAEALSKAVALDGRVLLARRFYARVLGGLRRYDEAVFQLVQAKRLAPGDGTVARELGIAFYDKGLYDKALRELERAAELAPDEARTHFALGLAHEAKGAIAAALGSYREAVRLSPSSVQMRRTLADALASTGEMAEAVEQLEQALSHDRTNTQVAMNLEILRRGLKELSARRLLGKREEDVDGSALVQEGQLKQRARGKLDDGGSVLCYGGELAEMWLQLDAAGVVTRLMLVLPDPQRAAGTPDDVFKVTVVGQDGRERPVDYATAVSLAFLREALGCPMTRASALYAQLLRQQQRVTWGGAAVGLGEQPFGTATRAGLYVEPDGDATR